MPEQLWKQSSLKATEFALEKPKNMQNGCVRLQPNLHLGKTNPFPYLS